MLPIHRKLSRLLGILYDAAADPTLWETFLQQLAGGLRADSAGLVMVDAGKDSFSVSRSWNVDPESMRLYQAHYGSVDVWAKRALLRSSGTVESSERLFPVSKLQKTEWYNDFLRRFSIEHGLFCVIDNAQSRLASVSLYRSRSCTPFQHSDDQVLRLLAPHLQRAFRLQSKFSELQTKSAVFHKALDALPNGIILLGSQGEIVAMNRSAEKIVAQRDGLLATRSQLFAEQAPESSVLAATIQQTVTTSDGRGISAGGTVLISRRARPAIQLLISPIHNCLVATSKPVSAVVFISDPLQHPRQTRATLHAVYRLTPAECRVALLLCDGHAPREIADTIGVTENTVRSQIKSIFSKTGVRRQGELIRLLLSSAGPTQLS
jgi:DNA-binding CsgD family transcriptional regulator/PAS domain-containing protein